MANVGITLLAAFLGSTVAAVLIERVAAHAIAERRRRGAARLYRDSMYRMQEQLRAAAVSCRWWFEAVDGSAATTDDRVLIAGHLSGARWKLITRATRLFDELEIRRRSRRRTSIGDLREAFEALENARRALAAAEPKRDRWPFDPFWKGWPDVRDDAVLHRRPHHAEGGFR